MELYCGLKKKKTFLEGFVDHVIYRDYIVNRRLFIYCSLASSKTLYKVRRGTLGPKARTSTQSYVPAATVSKMADRAKRDGDFCSAILCTNARNKQKSCAGKSFFPFPKDGER